MNQGPRFKTQCWSPTSAGKTKWQKGVCLPRDEQVSHLEVNRGSHQTVMTPPTDVTRSLIQGITSGPTKRNNILSIVC